MQEKNGQMWQDGHPDVWQQCAFSRRRAGQWGYGI